MNLIVPNFLGVVGDLHGDWQKAIDAFRMAGVISITPEDEVVWSGGDTVVVQLGDVLDRGDNEIGAWGCCLALSTWCHCRRTAPTLLIFALQPL